MPAGVYGETCIVDHSRSGVCCWCKEGASLLILISFGLAVGGSVLGGEPLVLLLDLGELPHVLEEVRATLQRDQELRLLAALRALVGALALAGDWDSHSADGLELGVLVPIKTSKIDLENFG